MGVFDQPECGRFSTNALLIIYLQVVNAADSAGARVLEAEKESASRDPSATAQKNFMLVNELTVRNSQISLAN